MIVKLWPGRNDEIKSNLAKRIAHTVAEELKVDMGDKLVGKHEHCYVEKKFKGNQCCCIKSQKEIDVGCNWK